MGCTPVAPPPAATEATPRAPSVLEVEPFIDSTVEVFVESTAVACAWGSTGVVSADAPIPYWVIGMVDVTAKATFANVELRRVRLLDAQGRWLGDGLRELEIREAAVAPDTHDFSRHGTRPFEGTLHEGQTQRLWFHARLGDGFEPTVGIPASYQLTLGVDGAADISIAGPVGSQWPTG